MIGLVQTGEMHVGYTGTSSATGTKDFTMGYEGFCASEPKLRSAG